MIAGQDSGGGACGTACHQMRWLCPFSFPMDAGLCVVQALALVWPCDKRNYGPDLTGGWFSAGKFPNLAGPWTGAAAAGENRGIQMFGSSDRRPTTERHSSRGRLDVFWGV